VRFQPGFGRGARRGKEFGGFVGGREQGRVGALVAGEVRERAFCGDELAGVAAGGQAPRRLGVRQRRRQRESGGERERACGAADQIASSGKSMPALR
jgi:hypothetical protein